jgi:polyphosphate glucokinase
MATVLGIDIGGTGIKGAPVDITTGKLLADRHRILTPHPATPKAVAEVVGELATFFDWKGPTGATFPAVVRRGVTLTAANVDKNWVGTNAAEIFSGAIGAPVTVVNDADAAGLAEMQFGAGVGSSGVVLMITLGTGIGSALFVEGVLVPNTELGHLELRGKDAERRAAESVRESEELSWKKWAKRLDEYFDVLRELFSPDLFIVGGGVSKKADKFVPHLSTDTKVVPALLLNDAGIVGAALAHSQSSPAGHAD